MFSKNKSTSADAPALNIPTAPKKGAPSVISSDLHILGNLVSDGLIDIDGALDGNIKAQQVTVRANGKVKGDVIADSIHVYGEVRGLIRAQTVYLYASCHVEGVIIHESLTVEDGAFIDGKFKRGQDSYNPVDLENSFGNDEGIIESPPSLRLIS